MHRGQQLLLVVVVVVGLGLHYGDRGGRNSSCRGCFGGGGFESLRTNVLNVLAKGTGVVGKHGGAQVFATGLSRN